MFSKKSSLVLIAIVLFWPLITSIMALPIHAADVSVWDYIDENRIRKVDELLCDDGYSLDIELNAIKNQSIGEIHLPYFTESDKMKDNSLCHPDSLEFGGDDIVKARFIKKLTDYSDEPGPDFFEDKMVMPYWTLDFRTYGPSFFANYTLGSFFEAYDSSVSDMLYLVFDTEDCFVFELVGNGGRPYVLRPWGAQMDHPDFARYRTIIWCYKEMQRQMDSTITRVMYSEVGVADVIIVYMTDNGAMAQLINGDKYVLLSEKEFQEVYYEYVANRNLVPGVQGGEGNAIRTTKENTAVANTKKVWIIASVGVFSACCVVAAAVFFKKRYCRKKTV